MLTTGAAIKVCGPFFVTKKDGSLRLILDTRDSNTLFAEPPYTQLASATALAEMEISPADRLHVRQGDVECCFYQFLLPLALQACFGLPSIQGRWLSKKLRQRLGIRRHDVVQFCLTVVPMGWS